MCKIAFGRGGLYDIFDIFRGPPCLPSRKFGISCHDNFDEIPDLSTVEFDGTILPKTMMDCRPVSPSGRLVFIKKFIKVTMLALYLKKLSIRAKTSFYQLKFCEKKHSKTYMQALVVTSNENH